MFLLKLQPMAPQRNITIALIFISIYYFSMGIWGFVILGPYLYSITNHSNTKVGLAEGIQGAALAIAAIPAGILADRFKRSLIMRFASAMGIVAIGLTFHSLLIAPKLSDGAEFVSMTVALAVWGLYRGMFDPALKSIYADSVSFGERSRYFTYLYNCIILASASGPVVNVILFSGMGNKHNWALSDMRTAFLVGVGIGAVTPFLLLLFTDIEVSQQSLKDVCIPEAECGLLEEQAISLVLPPPSKWYHLSMRWIPGTVILSDVIGGLASGMTIKFFPLFFENESHMSPVLVSVIFCISPLLTALFSVIAQEKSKEFGRVQVTSFVKVFGILLLFLMSFWKSLWTVPGAIIPIFIIRTALMNCTRGLMKSILMDTVPPSGRAKWNSLESITSFGWSGSAVLGGYLTDQFGYGVTFVLTASLQTISLLIGLTLLPIVPIEHELIDDMDNSSESNPNSK